MKLTIRDPEIANKISLYFSAAIRIMLNILLVIVIAALAISVIKAGFELWRTLNQDLENILQQVLLDVVIILALTEIAITILGYLKDGHVHVRYIVDTVLIIMLNEVVSAWFKHHDFKSMAALSVIIATLAAVRVSVTKWAPNAKIQKPLSK